MSVRILIANERPEILKLLRTFVEKDPRLEICGEAIDGGDVVSKAHQLAPELIILGYIMPVLNGIEAARAIGKFLPHAMLLLCASHLTPRQEEIAIDAGIKGVVAKTRLVELPDAVAALLRNETFFYKRRTGRIGSQTSSHGKRELTLPSTALLKGRVLLQSTLVPERIYFCEAVKEGTHPTRHGLLPDPDPLVCSQCNRTYSLHYSAMSRPVMMQLSRLLTTDMVESEHPRHSARLCLEVTPSNAVN